MTIEEGLLGYSAGGSLFSTQFKVMGRGGIGDWGKPTFYPKMHSTYACMYVVVHVL